MKQKTLFYCTECGNETAKWAGKCPACGAWNTIVERPEAPKTIAKSGGRTVRAGQAGSHRGMGWEQFTDAVIGKLNERERPIVFMLWGRNAAQKKPLITNPAHLVLTAAHPSPLSAYNGFFGCRHFSEATRFLNQQGMNIDWQIPDD